MTTVAQGSTVRATAVIIAVVTILVAVTAVAALVHGRSSSPHRSLVSIIRGVVEGWVLIKGALEGGILI